MQTGIELKAWRAVHESADLEAALTRILPVLRHRVPLAHLLIRRIDSVHRRLETIAAAHEPGGAAPARGRTEFGEADFVTLLEWSLKREILHVRDEGEPAWKTRLKPPDVEGEFLAAPLLAAGLPTAALVLVLTAGCQIQGGLEGVLAALLAPLGAALELGTRELEISRLREAADANQRATLQPQDITESIVGAETGLREVMERVELVARTDAPVLILGETGSGKEVVARAIHARSHRAMGPVLRVNCGAISPELVDSELFGHERGSFTGAVGARKGWFERADGGTLFLDEIGELSPAVQVRLLRILQDGTFERVGGQSTLTVDVRLVTATHRDLRAMVRQGLFREDLWYRISVFPIDLPPLRERRQDIPMLATLFAGRAGQRLGGGPLLPSAEDIDLLLQYDWPGNVRELAAVIERAVILGNARELKLRAALGGVSVTPRAMPFARRSGDRRPESVFPTLDQAMRDHIETALDATRGRIEGPHGAARLLGINPHTLRARMRVLGIDWKAFRGPVAQHR